MHKIFSTNNRYFLILVKGILVLLKNGGFKVHDVLMPKCKLFWPSIKT